MNPHEIRIAVLARYREAQRMQKAAIEHGPDLEELKDPKRAEDVAHLLDQAGVQLREASKLLEPLWMVQLKDKGKAKGKKPTYQESREQLAGDDQGGELQPAANGNEEE